MTEMVSGEEISYIQHSTKISGTSLSPDSVLELNELREE